jgi:hypothetical protein
MARGNYTPFRAKHVDSEALLGLKQTWTVQQSH